jgi:hypothetical protein
MKNFQHSKNATIVRNVPPQPRKQYRPLCPQGISLREQLMRHMQEQAEKEREEKMKAEKEKKLDEAKRKGGTAKYVYPDGTIYDGEWKDFKPHGYGNKIWPNKSYYLGEFVNGEISGQGHAKFINEGLYDGEWKNGSIIEGVVEFENPEANGGKKIYRGRFHNWKPHGESGEFEYSDGSKYRGEVKNGIEEGFGRKSCANGDEYEGYFRAGLYHGHGQLVTKAFNYEGYFVMGEREGWGSMECEDGSSYVGYWKQSKYGGIGAYHEPNNGRTFFGAWKGNGFHPKIC